MMHPVNYAPSQDFGDNPTKHLPASHWIIQQFGNYQPDGHTGIDYPCPVGTPVKAAAAGTVLHVGWLKGTYADNPWWIAPSFAGFVYVMDHGHFIGIYGHCMDGGARVSAGQRVSEGQVLGLSGNTGASTGPHLHFEVLPDGYILNGHMYGRINPHSLFRGSITPQSATITPQEENIMANASEQYLKDLINAVHAINVRTNDMYNRVFGRDVQRYYHPDTLEVRFEPFEGAVAARSSDVHDVIATNNLVVSQTRKILDAVEKVPGVDHALVAALRDDLAAELKAVTDNLKVTFVVEKQEPVTTPESVKEGN